eukprot:sb/3477614/
MAAIYGCNLWVLFMTAIYGCYLWLQAARNRFSKQPGISAMAYVRGSPYGCANMRGATCPKPWLFMADIYGCNLRLLFMADIYGCNLRLLFMADIYGCNFKAPIYGCY